MQLHVDLHVDLSVPVDLDLHVEIGSTDGRSRPVPACVSPF